MVERDDRWTRLARAARSAPERDPAPSSAEIARLARLAERLPEHARAWKRRRSELALLAAAAIVLALAWIAFAPDAGAWKRIEARSTDVLAALPDRVPRAPRAWSARSAVRALPDLGAWYRNTFTSEGSR